MSGYRCIAGVALVGLMTVALLGCARQSDSFQVSSDAAGQVSPAAEPEPAPAAPAPKSAFLEKRYKNAAGFTTTVKMTMWEAVPADVRSVVQHPLEAAATIDPNADYDPAKDVVIPFSLGLTNTTDGFSIESPSIRWTLDRLYVGADQLSGFRILECWSWIGGGWTKSQWEVSAGPPNPQGLSSRGSGLQMWSKQSPICFVQWSEALAPSDTATVVGFFVYRDKLTPAEPEGTKWVLDRVFPLPKTDGAPVGTPEEQKNVISLSGKIDYQR